jgi:cytochrome c oxidase subunit 2
MRMTPQRRGLLRALGAAGIAWFTVRARRAGAQNAAPGSAKTIQVTAKQFEFNPREITVKKGEPVVLELTSLDRKHGFNCPKLKLHAAIDPGKVARVEFTPQEAGSFPFHCDVVCGKGHDDMKGTIVVTA